MRRRPQIKIFYHQIKLVAILRLMHFNFNCNFCLLASSKRFLKKEIPILKNLSRDDVCKNTPTTHSINLKIYSFLRDATFFKKKNNKVDSKVFSSTFVDNTRLPSAFFVRPASLSSLLIASHSCATTQTNL